MKKISYIILNAVKDSNNNILIVFLILILFSGFSYANNKEINLKYEDLKFKKTDFLEGKIRVDLPEIKNIPKGKKRLYFKALMITYTPGTLGGYSPDGSIIVACPRKTFDASTIKKIIQFLVNFEFSDDYYIKTKEIYFDDSLKNSIIVKVSTGFFGKMFSDKTAIKSRLYENEKIFKHILESVEIKGADGKYFKPKVEVLPDKITDNRKKTKNDPMWEGLIPEVKS